MRPLPLLALALGASAIDLPPCQSRCYDMTAKVIGCEAEDYACHCAAFDDKFVPQLTSCMIEGCAFDNPDPLNTTDLKKKVCDLAGQSPAPSPPSETPTGDATTSPPTGTGSSLPASPSPTDPPLTSPTADVSSSDSRDVPGETESPAPTDGAGGGSGAAGLRVTAAAVLIPLVGGYLAL
ncbi:uncharacterized protein DNG_06690 [Cephalotrichum gorgonifer]|uniref:CFEM domain-containing protein n=1 Tax=Cephalotrichum gorgonifer TaxID=2041049 RepID=A0AAE8SXJ2_9PEZI|nr:uncharacterized protein DNG_06690 [Cephalotrichum gorgonifer]